MAATRDDCVKYVVTCSVVFYSSEFGAHHQQAARTEQFVRVAVGTVRAALLDGSGKYHVCSKSGRHHQCAARPQKFVLVAVWNVIAA